MLTVLPPRIDNVRMAATGSFSTKLAGMTLPDVDGKPVKLGSLWAERPAVVVFLRHYG